MALQIDYTDPTVAGGADFPQAYCHIDDANLPTLNGQLNVIIGIYVDVTHFNAGKPPVLRLTVPMTPADTATLRVQFAVLVENMLATGVTYPPFSGGKAVA